MKFKIGDEVVLHNCGYYSGRAGVIVEFSSNFSTSAYDYEVKLDQGGHYLINELNLIFNVAFLNEQKLKEKLGLK